MRGLSFPFDKQRPVAELPDQLWDALVIGAGPAGSTAALHLAARGRKVLLLDRQRFPRDKTCGDLLIADALHALDRAGLADPIEAAGCSMTSLSVFSPSKIECVIAGRYVTLRRRELDALIANRAIHHGAAFVHGQVQRVVTDSTSPPRAVVEDGRSLSARLIVVATGASVDLLRPLARAVDRQPSAMAARCYVRSSLQLDRLVISCDRSILPGYAWIFPLGDGLYNVGCGVFHCDGNRSRSNLRRIYATFIRSFPLARDLLAQAEEVTPLQGARLRCGLGPVPRCDGQPVLAIGETIGATFPFTGEGIGKAMETAEAAVEVIDAALGGGGSRVLDRFAHVLEARLRSKYEGYAAAQRWLRWPWVHDWLARRARHSRFVQESLAGIMAETIDPRQILSWRGFARVLLRLQPHEA